MELSARLGGTQGTFHCRCRCRMTSALSSIAHLVPEPDAPKPLTKYNYPGSSGSLFSVQGKPLPCAVSFAANGVLKAFADSSSARSSFSYFAVSKISSGLANSVSALGRHAKMRFLRSALMVDNSIMPTISIPSLSGATCRKNIIGIEIIKPPPSPSPSPFPFSAIGFWSFFHLSAKA